MISVVAQVTVLECNLNLFHIHLMRSWWLEFVLRGSFSVLIVKGFDMASPILPRRSFIGEERKYCTAY